MFINAQVLFLGTRTYVKLDAPNNVRKEAFYDNSLSSSYLNFSINYSFQPIRDLNWKILLGADFIDYGKGWDPINNVVYGISDNDNLYPYSDTTKRTFLRKEQFGINLGIQKMLFPEKRFSIMLSAYYRRGFGDLFRDENFLFYNGKRYQTNFVSTGSFFAINATAIYRIRL